MEGWAYFNNHHGGLVVLYKWSGSLKDERYKHPLHTVLCDFSVITPRCYKDVYVYGGLVILYKWSGSLKDERYKHPLHTMLCDFSVITPRCYKDVYVKSFFSDSKSRVNRHHVSLGSF